MIFLWVRGMFLFPSSAVVFQRCFVWCLSTDLEICSYVCPLMWGSNLLLASIDGGSINVYTFRFNSYFQGASSRDLNTKSLPLCSNGIHKKLKFPACTLFSLFCPNFSTSILKIIFPREMSYCLTSLFFFVLFLSVLSVSEWMAGGLVDRFLWKNIFQLFITQLLAAIETAAHLLIT